MPPMLRAQRNVVSGKLAINLPNNIKLNMGETTSIDEVPIVGTYAELEFGSTQFDLVGPRINNWIEMEEEENLSSKNSYS